VRRRGLEERRRLWKWGLVEPRRGMGRPKNRQMGRDGLLILLEEVAEVWSNYGIGRTLQWWTLGLIAFSREAENECLE
jgi:hypothetical protein